MARFSPGPDGLGSFERTLARLCSLVNARQWEGLLATEWLLFVDRLAFVLADSLALGVARVLRRPDLVLALARARVHIYGCLCFVLRLRGTRVNLYNHEYTI